LAPPIPLAQALARITVAGISPIAAILVRVFTNCMLPTPFLLSM